MFKIKPHVLMGLITVIGCTQVQYKSLVIPDAKPAFPAIYQIVTDASLGFREVNILKGTFVTDYVHKYDLLTKIRFQLEFRAPKHKVDVNVINMHEYDSESKNWIPNDVTLVFDKNRLRNDLLERIKRVLSDPEAYNRARHAALSDFDFNVMGMSSMTEVAANRWIKHALLNRVFTWRLPLSEFRETTLRRIGRNDYKYVATFSYTNKAGLLRNPPIMPGTIMISLYTNSDRFADFNKGEVIEVSGVLTSARKMFDYVYFFDFIDIVMSN